jgi:YegS/Rv2252/BmrU family lipid kinase
MTTRTQFRNAAIIYNPTSGRKGSKRARALARAVQLLEVHGMRCTLVPTTGPGSATEQARREVAVGRDLIIACGGDGTVNEIVNGMAGSEVPLALLPAGTANLLAKELGLPWNIHQAAEYIPRGRVRRIALGKANNRFFVCVAGAGIDAVVIQNFNQDRSAKGMRGLLAVTVEGFRQLALYDFPLFRVEAEGETFQASQIMICRSRAMGGPLHITQQASLFSNHFEVLLLPKRSKAYYLASFLADLGHSLPSFPGVRYLITRQLNIHPNEKPVHYEIDGEWIGEIPVDIELVPDALSLVVPEKMAE